MTFNIQTAERTLWYPGDMKPSKIGVYEVVSSKHEKGYKFWNGDFWGLWSLSPEMAKDSRWEKSVWQDHPWRGLAKEPK
jgi:hypothetical protein